MDLKWVKTFITVYEEGSFRAAADKLFISQPSITVHIKALEEELQVQLFKREHTKATITEVGKQYYVMAKKLLANVEENKKQIQNMSNDHKVRIVIVLSSALISTNLLKIVHDFMMEYRHYELEVIMGEINDFATFQNDQKIDIIFSLKKTKSTDLHAEQILSEPMKMVYATQAKIDGDTPDQQLRSILDRYAVYVGYLDEHIPIVESLQREYSIKQLNNIQDSLFAIKLIKENLGVGLLPPFQIATELAEGKLKVMDIGSVASIFKVDTYMFYKRSEERLLPFLSYVRNNFQ